MWNRHLIPALLATATLTIGGCQATDKSQEALAVEEPKIIASYSVLCHFLTEIAEDTIDLTCLIDRKQDPHTYSPTPSQRKALEQARVIFYGGYDFEPQIIDLIAAVDEDIPKIAVHEAVVTDPIMAKHEHSEEEEHEGHEQEELSADSHIWHDVYNAIAMIEYLHSSLLQLNPSQAALYLENYGKIKEELTQLHVWIQEQIATIPEEQRILVTTHDALNYYASTYELTEYKTLQGISPDDAPSAADLKNLVAEIEQTQVPTIFAEASGNNRTINNVAREAGVKLSDRQLITDGLGALGTDTDTYSKMMMHNTCAIVNGLGGKCQPMNLKDKEQ